MSVVRNGLSMTRVADNGLTLSELEKIEESAHHSQTSEANTVLRLAAALREALQAKENAFALVAHAATAAVGDGDHAVDAGKRSQRRLAERLRDALADGG